MNSLSVTPPVSAYIPCYNNAATVARALEGLQRQTYALDEIFVIDDGSTDNSAEIVESLGVRVVRQGRNLGRGAARARAMEIARNEFVLCCDATNTIAPNFTNDALRWFSDEKVIAVQGQWFDPKATSTVDRWRARHLFQQGFAHEVSRRAYFATYAAVLRQSAALRAGNYNASLRHGEDYDLGVRLHALGDVVFDPALQVHPLVSNTLFQVMERYARWNRASIHRYTFRDFLESHIVAWRILIPRDLRKSDWQAAMISAILPYFCLAYADSKFSHPASASTKKITGQPASP